MNNIVIFNGIIKDGKEPKNQNDVKNIFEKYIERSKNDRENFITDLLNNFNEVSDIFGCININEDILLKFINGNNEEINGEEKLAVEKFLQFSIKFLEIKITKINHINNILNLNKNELNGEDLVLLSNFLKNKNLDGKIQNIEITLKSKNEKSSEKLTLKEIIEGKDIFGISEHIKTFIDKLLKNEVYYEKNEEIENLNEKKLIYNFSENNEKNNQFNEDKLEEKAENEFDFQLEVDIKNNKNKFLELIFNLPQEKKIYFFDSLYEIIKLEGLDAKKSKIPALAYYLGGENFNDVYQVLVKLYKNNGYNFRKSFLEKINDKILYLLKYVNNNKLTEITESNKLENIEPSESSDDNIEIIVEQNEFLVEETKNNVDKEGTQQDNIQKLENEDEYLENEYVENEDIEIDSNISLGEKKYMSQISNHKILSAEEEINLFKKIKAGNIQAKNTLIECNLRLVVQITIKYMGKGVELEDLIQEGNISLYTAIEKFDLEIGTRFSTYATWWIRKSMQDMIANYSGVINSKTHKDLLEKKFWFRFNILKDNLGRIPTISELSEDLDLPEKKIKNILKSYISYIELDAPLDSEEDSTFYDTIDSNMITPEISLLNEYNTQSIVYALSCLKQKEKEIIISRFGLLDGNKATLQELADKYGLTHERIRQLEEKTLTKLSTILGKNTIIPKLIIDEFENPYELDYVPIFKENSSYEENNLNLDNVVIKVNQTQKGNIVEEKSEIEIFFQEEKNKQDLKNAEIEAFYKQRELLENEKKSNETEKFYAEIELNQHQNETINDNVSNFIKELAYKTKREQIEFFIYISNIIKNKQLVKSNDELFIDYKSFPTPLILLSYFFLGYGSISQDFDQLFKVNSFQIYKNNLQNLIENKLRIYWDILEVGNYKCDINTDIPLEINGYSRFRFPFIEQSGKEWDEFVKEVIDYNNGVELALNPDVIFSCKRVAVHGGQPIGSDIKRKKSKGNFSKHGF